MTVILCTHCGSPLRVRSDQAAGRCPRCRRVVEIPRDGTSPPDAKDDKATLESAAELDREDIDFLGPAQLPGELGRLGEYRILRLVGSGSMGIVFEAEDIKLHRRVALKVMKKSQARAVDNRQRFLHEARATAAIEHDHIVTIYQVGEDHGVPYLAMKLLVGESLDDRLNRAGPLPIEELIRVGREIAEGLAAAHERGLIHRDIKPANIWLEEGTGRVKIVDFGLARIVKDLAAEEAEKNWLIGTPLYMSPEQGRGGEITPRADLFSLGSLLYRAATGELPFKGKTARAVIKAVLDDEPLPPRKLNPEIPAFVSRLIMELLEKSPNDRPRNARLVVAGLKDALEHLHDQPEPEPEPEPEEEEEQPIEAEAEKPKPRRGKRKPKRPEPQPVTLEGRVIRFAIFAGICVFLLLAFLVIRSNFFRKKDDDPPPPTGQVRPLQEIFRS